MLDQCNERSKWITTVAFTDEDGDPVTPSAAYYRIDDVGTGLEIRGETQLTGPLSESEEIAWTTADTQILDQSCFYETRRMTVRWIYGGSQQNQKEYLLNIKNLMGAAAVSPP